MPRTKVSKSSKRFREASSCEEKLREFEASFDSHLITLKERGVTQIEAIEEKLYLLMVGTNSSVLHLLMGDILYLNLSKLEDCNKYANTLADNKSGARKQNSNKQLNPNDEGYLTEDSTNGGSAIGVSMSTLSAYSRPSTKQQPQRGRTPGPLSSARARRPRRSRSVCDDIVHTATVKSTSSASTLMDARVSRSKLRTPTASRSKAFSADRSCGQQFSSTSAQSPAAAFLRWPKPGEVVLSKCGSPVVAHVLPDKYANVNIPTRNGIFSLRPKKLEDLKSDIINAIDQDTLDQIRTLHDNLNLIMKMADGSLPK